MRNTDRYQGHCLRSVNGHETISSFDSAPFFARELMRNSRYNLCPICVRERVVNRGHSWGLAIRYMEEEIDQLSVDSSGETTSAFPYAGDFVELPQGGASTDYRRSSRDIDNNSWALRTISWAPQTSEILSREDRARSATRLSGEYEDRLDRQEVQRIASIRQQISNASRNKSKIRY